MSRSGPTYQARPMPTYQQQLPFGQGNNRNAAAPVLTPAQLQQQQHQLRATLRAKWANIFGGPAYLEGGPTNRLVLSLRSPVDYEPDWALDRVVQVSGVDPDLLRFVEFPGLLDALVQLIRAWLEALPSHSSPSSAYSTSPSSSFHLPAWPSNSALDAPSRRATEASLVLRNLAPEPLNADPLKACRKLPKLIVDVLSVPDEYATSEIRLAMLEILEVIGVKIPLILPGRALDSSDRTASPEPSDSPHVRLFPILVSLTASSDRALVLAAFRALTELSTNDASELVTALITYPPSSPHPHPIETAVSLLPLLDAELSLAALDFIYQHTLLPLNAVAFASRPDLTHILKLVCSKLHMGARKENVSVTLPMKDTEAEVFHRRMIPMGLYNRPKRAVQELSVRMSKQEMDYLLGLPEPTRALHWMRTAFEEYPAGEITQVALWTAYRTEFENHVTAARPMLPAAEVVKMSTEAFPSAMPMVTEIKERKFIIRGIRIRDRTDLRHTFACHWDGCAFPFGPTSQEMLYWHLHHFHALPSDTPACHWRTCTYTSNRPADLSLHFRTHIPVYYAPPGYTSPTAPAEPSREVSEPLTTMKYERYHAELDPLGQVTGLGFLSCLVLRNVARTVRTAFGAPGLAELAGGEESIFDALLAAEEGSGKKDEVANAMEKVNFAPAQKGKAALEAVEETLVRTVMENHVLGKLLAEVLAVVVAGNGAVNGNGAASVRK